MGIGWDFGFHGLGQHIAEPGAELDRAAVEAWTQASEGKEPKPISLVVGDPGGVRSGRGAQHRLEGDLIRPDEWSGAARSVELAR